MNDKKRPELPQMERFEILQCLGSGGFGVVYEVYDRERNARVALKTLHQADADHLYRFKQEFRCLADMTHPNLVTLYELLSDGYQWFFTMELVQGVDFLKYVSTLSEDRDLPSTANELETRISDKANAIIDPTNEVETLQTPQLIALSTSPNEEVATINSPSELITIKFKPGDSPDQNGSFPSLSPKALNFNPERLRETLKQLAAGIHALHESGKLHRDIKPSNVLVTDDGRVVILDFGIVAELSALDLHKDRDILGTPAYMSPEQGSAQPLSKATDWYSVGVMLYEALTGRRPFAGDTQNILFNKQHFEPPAPSTLVKGIPADLDLLCQQLLRRDPQRRPLGLEILQSLSATDTNWQSSKIVNQQRNIPFVGREAYLALLNEAFNTIKQEKRPATVYIQGRSGMGKSALVRHFLTELNLREAHLLVLSGRCYEQESVPYKALDSLVDALSQHLKQLPKAEVTLLLDQDVQLLARIFPVLHQVPAIIKSDLSVTANLDSQDLRRRAFTALREILSRLAKKIPLILYIDDLQWGDLDSASLLSELLRPPNAPPFLLLTTFRSEDINTSPLLTTLLPLRAKADPLIDVKEITIKELSPQESRQLAVALIGNQDRELLAQAEKIAQESKGHPFFVDELVRFAQFSEGTIPQTQIAPLEAATLKMERPKGGFETTYQAYKQVEAEDLIEQMGAPKGKKRATNPEDSGITRLDQMIQARVMRMPEEARLLLEIVAIAGQPVERMLAKQAAQLEDKEPSAFALLRANRMIRVVGSAQQEVIETYHDRIRETVVAHLSPETFQAHHKQLALLLEAHHQHDAERLANHFDKAGQQVKAVHYAIKAAEKAANALAFAHAARLYKFALNLRNEQDDLTHNLQIKLGETLINAGQCYEGAQLYLKAAETAPEMESLDLRQKAADQMIRSGYLKQGFAELRIITDKVGIKIPSTPLKAILSLLWQRFKIQIRGFEFKERDAKDLSAEDLLRLDTFWSVSTGLSMVDATRGVELQARHLLTALKIGEPHRIARALLAEAGYSSSAGSRKAAHTEKMLKMATDLVERLQYHYGRALAAYVAGIVAGCFGQWKRCIEHFARAEALLREHCTGVSTELDTINYWTFTSLCFIGDLNRLFNNLPAALKNLNERGNLFGETNLRLRTTYLRYLLNDEVENARVDIDEVIGKWSQPGFQMQHFWHFFGQMQILLYAGEAEASWQLINEKWPIIQRSFLLRIQSFYMQALHLRARSALALLAKGFHQNGNAADQVKLLKIVLNDAQLIEKEHMAWGDAFAQQIRATVAAFQNHKELAIKLLTEAQASFEAVDMALYAVVLKRRQGELIGGKQGKVLIEQADQWMQQQQIKQPLSMARMLAPGKWML